MTEGACGLQAAFKKASSSDNSTPDTDWAAVKTEDKTLMHQVCSIIPLPSTEQLTSHVWPQSCALPAYTPRLDL